MLDAGPPHGTQNSIKRFKQPKTSEERHWTGFPTHARVLQGRIYVVAQPRTRPLSLVTFVYNYFSTRPFHVPPKKGKV